MPMALANSTTSLYASGLVPACPITSAVLFLQISLAKCSARYFSGRPVLSANALGSMVEELVTIIADSGRY